MAQFMSIHRSPGLSREEFAATAPDVIESKHAKMQHVWVNIFEGFIVTLYEGENKEMVIKEFERLGFPYDEVHEIQIDMPREGLEALAAGQ